MAKKINLDEDGELKRIVEEFNTIESEDDLRVMNAAAEMAMMERTGRAPKGLPWPLTAGACVGLLAILTLIALYAYPGFLRKDSEIRQRTVPDLIGRSETAARQAVTNAGLRVILNYDESTSGKAGTVVEQRPSSGTRIADGSTVTVTVAGKKPAAQTPPSAGSGQPEQPGQVVGIDPGVGVNPEQPQPPAVETVAVPDIEGMMDSKARKKLEELGFKVSTKIAADASLPNGIVVSSDPKPNTLLEKGATVQINVNVPPVNRDMDEPPALVAVGNYAGKTGQEAVDDLKSRNLTPTLRTETSRLQPSGYVIRTEPSAGTQVAPGSTVTVVTAK